jgi:integral membrane protein
VTGESWDLRALRVVALVESLSFALLLVGSVLKRTTELDVVPALGPVHGALYVLLVVLVLACLDRLRWSWWFTLVMLTVGSPGAHFAVKAQRTSPSGPVAPAQVAP